jgi:eukaryotic-like serine/threonine-protein kinase
VLELVEGETLADRIARGPIPIDEALPIASQIAEALEAAHEQGVTHRDLKPANIKVRRDGTVKVLDFGLAKLIEATAPSTPHASLSPTITSPALMTGVGVLLGTAAYMSPEQAKRRPTDKRSDIWAFGCVLYEMVTGRRAFPGEDVADTLAFVLTKEPDWNALPETTPIAIQRLLHRSLEKNRKLRLSDVADARIEIREAADEGPVVEYRGAKPPKRVANRERVAWVGIVLLGVGITAVVSIARSYLRPTDDLPEMRVDIVTPSTNNLWLPRSR